MGLKKKYIPLFYSLPNLTGSSDRGIAVYRRMSRTGTIQGGGAGAAPFLALKFYIFALYGRTVFDHFIALASPWKILYPPLKS